MKAQRIRAVAWAMLLIVIVAMVGAISIPLYDTQAASEALGTIYAFDEGWIVTYADGTQEKQSIPFVVPKAKSKVITMENLLPADYSGLALALKTKNAAIRIYVNGRPVYQAGYVENTVPMRGASRLDDLPGGSAVDPALRQLPPDQQAPESPESDSQAMPFDAFNENATRIEANDNLIDLPYMEQDAGIRIVLEAVSSTQGVSVTDAKIAKRDAAVINQMRNVIYPLGCILVILIAMTVMVVMDATRMISGTGKRGVLRLLLFALVVITYCAIQTGLFVTFVDNGVFFGTFEEMCFLMMPVILHFCLEKRLDVRYRKYQNILIGYSALTALALLILRLCGVRGYPALAVAAAISLVSSVLFALYAVLDWGRKNVSLYFETAGLVFLLIAALAMPVRQLGRESFAYLDTVVISAFTLFFVLLMVQEIRAALLSYKEKVGKTAQTLELQNKQLLEATKEAEEARHEAILANEAKGKFLANMSHEIRTPINAVLGMDEMILRESKEKHVRGYAADIFTAGQTLLSLINDILDFSKIESGKMEIVPVEYDMSSLIHDLSNMITQRAKAKDLSFEVTVEPTIPARFFGDDVRIRQVLTNILTNSVKYTNTGNVWFRVTGTRDGGEELLRFEIEDTGIGIKEEDIPKLFKAYERIEESRNRNIEGTGLGMNITMQLLHMMGGTLDVKSVYGKGSVFVVELRQKIVDDTPLGDFGERIRGLQENYTYSEAFRAPDAKILVVDDNSMNRKVFVSFLKLTEIQIDEAESGQASIELAKRNRYDIIFMDHMMPEMDGVEAMHRIKAMDGPCRDTPIFVLTANAVVGAKEAYLKDGFDGFLSKPIAAKKLEDAIRATLDPALVQPAKAQQDDLPPSGAEVPDDLPTVDGLDWNIAYLHLSTTELVSASLQEFYRLLPVHAEKLQGFYDGLSAPGGPDAYRIQVHAMKSMAATVGIIPLAGMAKVLEYAARDGDADVIHAMHGIFMKEWLSYEAKLDGVFGIGAEDTAKKESADPKAVKALLEILQTAMEDFDVDAADATMAKLLQYDCDADTLGKLKKMQAAVTDLDNELVETLAQDIAAAL